MRGDGVGRARGVGGVGRVNGVGGEGSGKGGVRGGWLIV